MQKQKKKWIYASVLSILLVGLVWVNYMGYFAPRKLVGKNLSSALINRSFHPVEPNLFGDIFFGPRGKFSRSIRTENPRVEVLNYKIDNDKVCIFEYKTHKLIYCAFVYRSGFGNYIFAISDRNGDLKNMRYFLK